MRSLLVLLGLMVSASTTAHSSEVSPLMDADAWVAMVLAGPAGVAAGVDVGRARADADGTGLWSNPHLRLERQSGPALDQSKGSQDFLAVEIPLALSGRLGLQREAAERRVDAAGFDARARRAQLAREAIDAFVDVVGARRRSRALDEERARLAPVAAMARVRADAGESSEASALRLEIELARVDDTAAASHAAATAARFRAEGLVVAPVPAFADVLPGAFEASVASSTTSASRTPAAVSALQLHAEAATLDEAAAGRGIVPDVIVGGGPSLLNTGAANFAVGYLVTIDVELPLFDHAQGDAARARADRAAIDGERAMVVRRIDAARSGAVVIAEAARARRDAFASSVDHARGLFDAAAKDLAVGNWDVVAFVDAAAALREARLHLVSLQEHSARADADLSYFNGALESSPEQSR